jgi:hypothetical protein
MSALDDHAALMDRHFEHMAAKGRTMTGKDEVKDVSAFASSLALRYVAEKADAAHVRRAAAQDEIDECNGIIRAMLNGAGRKSAKLGDLEVSLVTRYAEYCVCCKKHLGLCEKRGDGTTIETNLVEIDPRVSVRRVK